MRWWLLASVAVAAVGVYVIQPAGAMTPSAAAVDWPPSVRGVVHVHSRRSDGSGTIDQIAAEAARAGLEFVIVTDHGDGAREPEPPSYRSGVLCIDAVEVGTEGGHVLALGLPGPTPYPLGGRAADVVEDIARLGGFSIAAHPDSPKPEMRWNDWDLPFDGLEWLNGDSEWRDESYAALARVLVTLPFAGGRALSLALDRPETTLRRWDDLLQRKRVVALAGADAHARLGSADGTAASGAALHLPAYRAVFEMLSVTVSPLALTRNAKTDAAAIVNAIRAGRVYSSVDALATPARLSFRGTSGSQSAVVGDVIEPVLPVVFEVATNAPAGSRITLLRDGAAVAMSSESPLRFDAPAAPAVYRVEVEVAGAPGTPPVPWIVSNPIYVGARSAPVRPGTTESRPAGSLFMQYPGGKPADWTVETSVRSKAEVNQTQTARGPQLAMRWALGGTLSESPFAAAVLQAGAALHEHGRLLLTARASKPTRLSVQLRIPRDGTGERWRRSVYLDIDAREFSIPFGEMTPVGAAPEHPALAEVRDLLFVIDTVNTALGANGQVWIDRIAYAP